MDTCIHFTCVYSKVIIRVHEEAKSDGRRLDCKETRERAKRCSVMSGSRKRALALSIGLFCSLVGLFCQISRNRKRANYLRGKKFEFSIQKLSNLLSFAIGKEPCHCQ